MTVDAYNSGFQSFDIYPRLEATASNKETYRRFLDEIIRTYENVYDKEERRTDEVCYYSC